MLAKLELPIDLTLEGDRSASISDFDDQSWQLSIERSIDQSSLELITETYMTRTNEAGEEETVPAIYVHHDEAISETHVLARSLASTLSFLLDGFVHFSRRNHSDQLIPETDDERRLLEGWGTSLLIEDIRVSVAGGSVTGRIAAGEIESVLPQQAGLRLYEEALRADTATAKFRDLWRVLESAFVRTDTELTSLLAGYRPLQAMGADASEFKGLLVLRGRASHAQSKAGLREVTEVEELCDQHLARLKNLVERVIETKKSWGYPTVAALERLEPGRRRSVTERHVISGETLVIGG